ncbi:uncharacterized protein [Argopecten irradians]|uniref:uncharacterized protein n=1 Tax=Argopecten irradians TaxID=31199 RepID=UPI0037215E8A
MISSLSLLLLFNAVSADNVIYERGVAEISNPEYTDCTTDMTAMRDELSNIRNENREMKEAIAELQVNMRNLQQRDADNRKLLDQNLREITLLKSQQILSSKTNQTRRTNRFLLKDTYNYIDTNKQTRPKLSDSQFYARLGQKFEVQSHEQTIIYDVVMTNDGLAYDNKTGIFTCTSSGVYVFSWSALVTADHYVETILRSNKADLGLTYSGNKEYPGSGSQTVVVNLHQGDHVRVKVGSFIPGSVLYDIYTSFSGFQLH